MFRNYGLLLILFAINKTLVAQPKQSFRIITDQTSIQYLKSKSAGASTAVRNVTMQIEYWTDNKTGNVDTKFKCNIASSSAALISSPSINMMDVEIFKDSFDIKHKKMTILVPVTIKVMPNYSPEFFTIGLKDSSNNVIDASTGGTLAVIIQEESIKESTIPTPDGFSIINGANFDFDGNSGASYVGNLNLFKPTGFARIENLAKRFRFGYDLGIMKINFSRNDSLNSSYDYFENVLVKPLDSIKPGTKFLRQYNKLSTVSKNLTWSFYFQPTLGLVNRDNLKILFHLHTELFIDKWTTKTVISNYQQDTSIINLTNFSEIKDSLRLLNKFAKSTTDLIESTSVSTKLNFNFGFGITLEKSWDGGSLFVQPTIGWAIDYERPRSINTNKLEYNAVKKENPFAHLTRFRLNQKITTNVQAVVGIDVRGKFGFTPTYAAFVGANIGYEGLRKLLQ